MAWFEGFAAAHHEVNGVRIFARTGGQANGPPVLLVHGFPHTHAVWHRVARVLANRFFLVLPDLRGYGDSSRPPDVPDHASYSKRAMAADLVALMRSLGHERFGLVGHDRGGRVAHRLALDHPEAVSRLGVIDIAPTLDMYEAADVRFATDYYHWFYLIQPATLPEHMIGGDPIFYLHWTLGSLGAAGVGYIEPEALAEYERCFNQPETIHGMCEDYRASAGIDLEHDRAARAGNQRIACDVLVLWGRRGVVHRLFDPMTLWQARCAGRVTGLALDTGHFVPEEAPEAVAGALLDFLGAEA
jgi:haloacetate dehalogenase